MKHHLTLVLLLLVACQHAAAPLEEIPPQGGTSAQAEATDMAAAEGNGAEQAGNGAEGAQTPPTLGGLVIREPDLCDAETMQHAIGQPFEQVDTSGVKRTIRVIRPDTIYTQEYNAQRMNFFLDAEGVVTAVKCG